MILALRRGSRSPRIGALAGRACVRDSVYGTGGIGLSPSTGLGNDQFVNVSLAGLRPLQVVFFRQCTAQPDQRRLRDCTAHLHRHGFTDGNGAGQLYEHVAEGDVAASERRALPLRRSRRRARSACSPSASLGVRHAEAAAFAPTPDGCPAPSGAAIAGGGADEANHAIYEWGVHVCEPPPVLGVNYIPANSQDGLENFVNGLNDFAVTGLPVHAPTELTAADRGRARPSTYAPITTSGAGARLQDLRPGPGTRIAGRPGHRPEADAAAGGEIFTGQISNWHADPEINALNPGHVFRPRCARWCAATTRPRTSSSRPG